MTASASRRYFAPEVIQSSAMDCGPASLKSMLEGFGIHVGYGRLREACSTDVDGTSIDTLQDMATELGLEVEQTMVPLDHLLSPEAGIAPAIVVIQLQGSGMHFIVLWRRHRRLVQVMDPSVGRRWMTEEALLRDVYEHDMVVDADAWREFAATDAFRAPLVRRMTDIGVSAASARARFDMASRDPSWKGLARLDAAVRMLAKIAKSGGTISRVETERMLEKLCDPSTPETSIPDRFWSVFPAATSEDGTEQISLRGAVLVRCAGRATTQRTETEMGQNVDPALLSALRTPEETSWKPLYAALRESGAGLGSLMAGALAIAAATVLVQALLLRGALDIGYWLGIGQHRLGAAFALATFLFAVLLLELPLALALTQLGRKLEVLIRVAFQRKIPRTADHYFHSRLLSDLASRLHVLPVVRSLPGLAATWLRTAFLLVFTVAGILWLAPWLVHWVVATTVIAVLLSLFSMTLVQEREMRVQSHNGTLSRFYLDALQGVSAIRAHSAGRALMREQEGILVQWADAARRLLVATVAVETVQAVMGVALAIGLVSTHVSRHGTTGSLLLVTYWALQLPALAQSLAVTARQVPAIRNTLVRVLEPLGAPEETESRTEDPETVPAAPSVRPTMGPPAAPTSALVTTKPRRDGVRIELVDVDVRAGGHPVLGGVNIQLEPGAQVGIVGASGAGKSTLIGLLLGWSRPATGRILLDGEILTPRDLAKWRRRTAWVDPAVQLFNRPLVQNILYGNTGGAAEMARAIDAADLRGVLERLPEGLQTVLGEAGALVSGGEGQRVRLARAWLRDDVRLVLLDEPFRGLDRDKRRVLLDRARAFWAGATMICVTHDIADTLAFSRVLVIENGRIVEDGDPRALACDLGSRYHAMLADEQLVRESMWANPDWRRIRIENGQVVEQRPGEWTDLPELIAGAAERET